MLEHETAAPKRIGRPTMMTKPVGRFAHTSATANRELPTPIGSPKSFDTVTLHQRGFDTVLIRLGLFRAETGEDEKTKRLKRKDLSGGRAGTRTPDLLRVKQAL